LFADISKIAKSEAIDESNVEEKVKPGSLEVELPKAENETLVKDQKAKIDKTEVAAPELLIRVAEPIPSLAVEKKGEAKK
jgi:hypothetical protein